MKNESAGNRVAKFVLYGILILVLLIFVAPFLLIYQAFPVLIFHLLFGWVFHAGNVLLPFLQEWRSAVMPMILLLVAGVFFHGFMGWWVKAKRKEMVWRIRHSGFVITLLLLCSGAAIAASGVVHQLFWLAQEPITYNRGRRTELVQATINAKQLVLALEEYQVDHGKYPERLMDLMDDGIVYNTRLFTVLPEGKRVAEPFVLLHPGRKADLPPRTPVLISPLLDRRKTYVVGFADMSVDRVKEDELWILLEEPKQEAGDD